MRRFWVFTDAGIKTTFALTEEAAWLKAHRMGLTVYEIREVGLYQ